MLRTNLRRSTIFRIFTILQNFKSFLNYERQKFVELGIIHAVGCREHQLTMTFPIFHVSTIFNFSHHRCQFAPQRLPRIPYVATVYPIVIHRDRIFLFRNLDNFYSQINVMILQARFYRNMKSMEPTFVHVFKESINICTKF